MNKELELMDLENVTGGADLGSTTSPEKALRDAWNSLGLSQRGFTEHMFEEYLDEFTAGNFPPQQAKGFLQDRING